MQKGSDLILLVLLVFLEGHPETYQGKSNPLPAKDRNRHSHSRPGATAWLYVAYP